MVYHGKLHNPVQSKGTIYQHTQACKNSQLDSDFAEAMDQLIIQKYREEGRSQSPNVYLWDDILFRVMLLIKTLIAVNHIGDWKDYYLLEQHWSQSNSHSNGRYII